MKNKRNQTAIISPEEAMNSYFGDFFSESSQAVSDKDDSPLPCLEFISSVVVKPGYGLITTSNLNGRIVDFSQPQHALVEPFILLLWDLYFLRQPISGKLRTHIFEHCNEMRMEYQLLLDLLYERLGSGGAE